MEKKKMLDQAGEEGLSFLNGIRVGIVTAEWNADITFAMRDAAIEFLSRYMDTSGIVSIQVPGSFELVHSASKLLPSVDGLIVIGCVIQGETPHFTFISQAVANGIANLNISSGKPVIFGVLTTDTMEQALSRAGGKHGNKGIEAASTLVKMLNIKY